MPKIQMKDIIVLLPGIMGSILQKNGKDIWNLSIQALWGGTQELIKQGSLLEELILLEDDPEKDYLEDGIKATGLIQDAHLIPGFYKIDGYSYLRNQLTQNFDLTFNSNYLEFAYDWRRDNKISARLLKRLIDNKLSKWKEKYPKAKIILIAHSMGGLISRYYLEHLGGKEQCKALITLGTPYRGSVKILNFLTNGYQKKPLPALTDVLRSFTSGYQLLPIYPVIDIDGNWLRITETNSIPGIEAERAKQARRFLQLVNSPNNTNPYQFKPIIGIGQKRTFQSVQLSNNRLKASYSKLPMNPKTQKPLDNTYATGDDTVPLLSAIPIDLSNDMQIQDASFIESHGALQNNVQVWNLLKRYLMQLQDNIQDFQNPQIIQSVKQTAGISLSLDDLYFRDEEFTLNAEIINIDPETLKKTKNFGGLNAIITPVKVNQEQEELEIDLQQQEDTHYQLNLQPNILAPGLYRLEVETNKTDKQAPKSIHNLFAISE